MPACLTEQRYLTMSDTIAAISTGNVLSGIGIVRLSGSDTLAIIDKVFTPAAGKKPQRGSFFACPSPGGGDKSLQAAHFSNIRGI